MRLTQIRLCTAIGLITLLNACAAPHAAVPSLNVQTQTVYVDRPVPCVQAADVPAPPAALPPRPADARAALDIALAKVIEWTGYGEKADPLLRSCAKP